MTFIKPGTPRIALLNINRSWAGGYASVNYLPSPNAEDGVSFEWIEKRVTVPLIDGSEATRRLGWIPELVLKWSVYNDLMSMNGYQIGSANGCQLDSPSLLALLDNPVGSLFVSPGPTYGGFIAETVTIGAMGIKKGLPVAKDVAITFRAGTIYSRKVLGAF